MAITLAPADLAARQTQQPLRLTLTGLVVDASGAPVPGVAVSIESARSDVITVQTSAEGHRRAELIERHLRNSIATWANPRVGTVAADVLPYGAQFDDDQNTLELRRFAVVDATATRALTRVLHLLVAVENLFDTEYDVGRTPVTTVGWPRTVRVGFRVFLP